MDKESLEKYEEDLREFAKLLGSLNVIYLRLSTICDRERERERLLGVEAEVTNFENR